MKRKLWIVMALAVLIAAVWCGTAMAANDFAFTQQPQNGVMKWQESCTISWRTNHTPQSAQIEYRTPKLFEEGMTEWATYAAAEIASNKLSATFLYREYFMPSLEFYEFRVCVECGDGFYDKIYSDTFSISYDRTTFPQFTLQPQSGMMSLQTGSIITWRTNHTPQIARIEYRTPKVLEEGMTEWATYAAAEIASNKLSATLPYHEYIIPSLESYEFRVCVECGDGFYDKIYSDTFHLSYDETTFPRFTRSPSSGIIYPWTTKTLFWATNFTPKKVEIVYIKDNRTNVYDTLTSSLSKSMSYELTYNASSADEWYIFAYSTADEYCRSNAFSIEKRPYVTVMFDPRGGSVSQDTAQTGTNGKLMNLPRPTREGFNFNYWYIQTASGQTVVTSDTIFTQDTTIYASWSGIFHTISVVDGTSDRSGAPVGQTVHITANEREYFTFSNWTVVSGDVTLADPYSASTSFVMGIEPVTIRAYYTYSGEQMTELYVYVTEPVAGEHPAAPFITSDVYNINNYQWFDIETGAEMTETDVFESGRSYRFNIYIRTVNMSKIIDPSVVGYVNDSTDGVICEYQTFFQAHIEKTFETGYNVSFDANGGLGSMADVTVKESEYVLPPCEFTAPDRWAFVGWDCGQPGTAITVTSDLTISALWETDCIPVTEEYFPDPNFRTFVSSNYDQNGDGLLTQAERDRAIWMTCDNKGIASFEGIEYFQKLVRLIASNNPDLTALNMSMNQNIDTVQANNCAITDIDVSGCLNLYSLLVSGNPLASLDVSTNIKLHQLNVIGCTEIHAVDLSSNPEMLWLNTYGSGIKWLDIGANAYLLKAYAIVNTGTDEYDYYGNGDYYMKVNKGTEFVNFGSGGIPVDEAHFPNAAFRAYVTETFDVNDSGWLSEEEINNAISIDIDGIGGLANVQGIEYLTELENIAIGYEPLLNTVDLSANKKLTELSINNTGLTSLDVTGLPLTSLYCPSNQLVSLTLGAQPNLKYLGNYRNSDMNTLDISGAPHLITAWLGTKDSSSAVFDRYSAGDNILAVDKGLSIFTGIPAPTFILPAALTTIESEAFSGIATEAVLIPASVISISGDPFAGSSVRYIYGTTELARNFAEVNGYTFVPVRE